MGALHLRGDAVIASAVPMIDALRAEGFPVPQHCQEARIMMTVDAVLCIHYEVWLTNEDLVKIGRALQRVGESAK